MEIAKNWMFDRYQYCPANGSILIPLYGFSCSDGDVDDLAYLLSDVQDDIAEEILCKADYANGLPPSDDYGLSAMVVMVNNSNGNLSSVYSRYNLPNMFDGFIIDYNGLTNILGKDATSVFVPNKQNEE